MGDRVRITYKLVYLFGETFAKGAFWYSNPDVNSFIASLLHIASWGRVSVTANVTGLFVKEINATFRVCPNTLHRLGCTTQELFELLRRTPGAPLIYRASNAAPLLVHEPSRATADHQVPLMLSPNLFDAEVPETPAPPPIFNFTDDITSTTTTMDYGAGGDGDDDNLLLDVESAFWAASFEERSALDDTVDELLTVERELEAVGNRFRMLLNRRRDALGDAPRRFTGTLENLLEDVHDRRVAAAVERDAGVASLFISVL